MNITEASKQAIKALEEAEARRNVTEGDLLGELAKEFDFPPLLPDDVTVDRLVKRTGKRRNAICNFLSNKLRDGELIRILCVNPETKCRTYAYRKP